MKSLLLLIFCVATMTACSQKINPIGTYKLHTSSGVIALNVKSDGVYRLEVLESASNKELIEGRWELNESPAPTLSLHGVKWRGTQPEPGHSIWAATIEGDSRICLDAEGINCFQKD
ncbi:MULTISPECIES: hypothetical protein [unclassified Janthinobacterium]|uniref:hypothetical protein n=1 Tax=unclassified Janthinobacterium TaxID=2610881 RepID=UPI001608E622|nr:MULTISPECIES: hypothetical protein [unclassified Janthinobacterium]MBB5371692.1 ABC-type uncharacterized transport system auxiliary subunit [Janthinobacterium sp. K2C7]MBB5384497.1 ABC-type uncharacterized transport system auxiliary subunit [Janthinobacterium sp. K2Li3]MBB5389773.1 ABC-type uncharacterized transport system auxiliary subunit [Janthinobacterium sp. K2E3]